MNSAHIPMNLMYLSGMGCFLYDESTKTWRGWVNTDRKKGELMR